MVDEIRPDNAETPQNEAQPDFLTIYNANKIEDASRVRIEINLDVLADNKDIGTKLLRGHLDEVKGELLAAIRAKRIKAMKMSKAGQIIIPGGLEVH